MGYLLDSFKQELQERGLPNLKKAALPITSVEQLNEYLEDVRSSIDSLKETWDESKEGASPKWLMIATERDKLTNIVNNADSELLGQSKLKEIFPEYYENLMKYRKGGDKMKEQPKEQPKEQSKEASFEPVTKAEDKGDYLTKDMNKDTGLGGYEVKQWNEFANEGKGQRTKEHTQQVESPLGMNFKEESGVRNASKIEGRRVDMEKKADEVLENIKKLQDEKPEGEPKDEKPKGEKDEKDEKAEPGTIDYVKETLDEAQNTLDDAKKASRKKMSEEDTKKIDDAVDLTEDAAGALGDIIDDAKDEADKKDKKVLEKADESLDTVEEDLSGKSKEAKRLTRKARKGEKFADEAKQTIKDVQKAIDKTEDIVDDVEKVIPEEVKNKKSSELDIEPEEVDIGDVPSLSPTDEISFAVKAASRVKKAFNFFKTTFGNEKEASFEPVTKAEDKGDYLTKDMNKDTGLGSYEVKQWNAFDTEGKGQRTKEHSTPRPHGPMEREPKEQMQLNLIHGSIPARTGWRVRKGNGPVVFASFEDVCDADPRAMTLENYKAFTSDSYGRKIASLVSSKGIFAVQKESSGRWVIASLTGEGLINLPLRKTAKDFPKSMEKKIDELSDAQKKKFKKTWVSAYDYAKDKENKVKGSPDEYASKTAWDKVPKSQKNSGLLRKQAAEGDVSPGYLKGYYTKAYGDASYAGQLTSQAQREAHAKQAFKLARIKASRGLVPFTKEALVEETKAIMDLSPEDYQKTLSATSKLPVTDSKILTAIKIPSEHDTESGISYDSTKSVPVVSGPSVEKPIAKGLKEGDTANLPDGVTSAEKLASEYHSKGFQGYGGVDPTSSKELGDAVVRAKDKVRRAAGVGVVPQLTKTSSENQQTTEEQEFNFNTLRKTAESKGTSYDDLYARSRGIPTRK